jgi:hypothetical protein
VARRRVWEHRHEVAHQLLSSPLVFVGRPRAGEPSNHSSGARGFLVRNHVDVVFNGHEHLTSGLPSSREFGISFPAAADGISTASTRARSTKRVVGAPLHGRGNCRRSDVLRPSPRKVGRSTAVLWRTADAAAKTRDSVTSRGRTGAARQPRGVSRSWSSNAEGRLRRRRQGSVDDALSVSQDALQMIRALKLSA